MFLCFRGREFQILHFWTPRIYTSAIYKDGGRQDKCHHISKTISHRVILLPLLDSMVDSNVNGSITDLHQPLNYRHLSKMAPVKPLYFRNSRNTLFNSLYHRFLGASYRQSLKLMSKYMHLISGVMSIRRPLSLDVCETPLIPLFSHAHRRQLGFIKSNIVLHVQWRPV